LQCSCTLQISGGTKSAFHQSTLAERLNLKTRQVQRHIAELEKAGFVKRKPRFKQKGQTSNGYDLSGLVAKLKDLEPEFRKADDEAKHWRREIARPRPRARITRSTDKSPP
jgi:predicted ArsR family transcriptional regulator